jgi:hypothetical protein
VESVLDERATLVAALVFREELVEVECRTQLE